MNDKPQVQQSADALTPQLRPLLGGGSSSSSPAKKAKKVGLVWVRYSSGEAEQRPLICTEYSPINKSTSTFNRACISTHPHTQGFGAKAGGAGAAGGGYQRFAVELPVADVSPAACARLASDMLRRLPGQPAAWQVVYADAAAAAAGAAAGQARALQLQQACRAAALGGPLLIVAPALADVALVEQLVQEVWSGPCAVVLNPTWHEGLPREYEAVVRSFEVAYSFTPISIKGLVGGQEGAVVRRAGRGGALAGAPWQILATQRDGRFLQVGQMKKRPAQSDLELAFMNASAAKSPLTGAVKSAKSLLDRVLGSKE